MSGEKLEFEGVTGVGQVHLNLEPNQRVYTFIGANGVGKTKTLESLFQVFFLSNEQNIAIDDSIERELFRFKSLTWNAKKISISNDFLTFLKEFFPSEMLHSAPVVYLGAQSRGVLKHNPASSAQVMGNFKERRQAYYHHVIDHMSNDFGSLNMETSIEAWFIALARSSNPYQKKEDNRDIEIRTVIQLLHQIDSRIDPEFLEISGDDRVSLKIEGQKRELSQLSSGFTSILKLIQAIVSGYGYFTNEVNLQHVKGIVLIDEIESHLHLTWQANIIPLLKRLFPNTVFYITTHSSIVLSQLQEGEAYTLYRDETGVVQTRKIEAPNKAALVDIMKDVFKVDLNQMKLDNSNVDEQQEAKKRLLQLLKQQEKK
ncbi:AAA family ATPase [Enterobacter sp.]|uniref:AAA family ATPase n=1 Tax=Enterobacter sp. TaxID=42895 RepID=UPI00296F5AA3|nr:AAA family ATPase [Enterobacter sp.]